MNLEHKRVVQGASVPARKQILAVLTLGLLMNVLDENLVYIVLPQIRAEFGFSPTSLVWVVNAQFFTYAAFLMVGGRLSDLLGPRQVYLCGSALLTLGSLGCSFAGTPGLFLGARATQGIGGALIATAALSLALSMFTAERERATVMGAFASVSSGGGCIALLLGGLLTSVLSWRWVFLINLPVGAAVCAYGTRLLPERCQDTDTTHLDILGVVTASAALLLALYAVTDGSESGFTSPRVVWSLVASLVILLGFITIETLSKAPLIPLGLLKVPNFLVANGIGMLLSAAMFGWGFITSLYMQLVLGYSPLKVAIAFLPATATMAIVAIGVSARLVTQLGIKTPLSVGLVLVTAGLLLLARAPVKALPGIDLLPSMLLVGLGNGMVSSPLLLASFSNIRETERGIASGVLTTSSLMGGLFGLSGLVGLAAARTDRLRMSGVDVSASLNGGYHAGFLIASLLVAAAAWASVTLIRYQHTNDRQQADNLRGSACVTGQASARERPNRRVDCDT